MSVVDGLKVKGRDYVQFKVSALRDGSVLRYNGNVCARAYPHVAYEQFGLFLIRVRLDEFEGVRVPVQRDVEGVCEEVAEVLHPLLLPFQPRSAYHRDEQVLELDDHSFVPRVCRALEDYLVSAKTDGMGRDIMLMLFLLTTRSVYRQYMEVGASRERFYRHVLAQMMTNSRMMVMQYMNMIWRGLEKRTVRVLDVLQMSLAPGVWSADGVMAPDALADYLADVRVDGEADVLVYVRDVLTTEMIHLKELTMECGGVLHCGDLYIWTSGLRKYFVEHLQQEWDASRDKAMMAKCLFEYVSADVIWTRAYGRTGRLFMMYYEGFDAEWIDKMLRGRLGCLVTTFTRGMVDVERGGVTISVSELRRRVKYAVQMLILQCGLDGPISEDRGVKTRKGERLGYIVYGLPKNRKCLSLSKRCATAGHQADGKLFFRAWLHDAKFPTRITAHSQSSHHTTGAGRYRSTLAKIEVKQHDDGKYAMNMKQFNA